MHRDKHREIHLIFTGEPEIRRQCEFSTKQSCKAGKGERNLPNNANKVSRRRQEEVAAEKRNLPVRVHGLVRKIRRNTATGKRKVLLEPEWARHNRRGVFASETSVGGIRMQKSWRLSRPLRELFLLFSMLFVSRTCLNEFLITPGCCVVK